MCAPAGAVSRNARGGRVHLHKADRDLRADGKKIRTEAAQK